MQISFDEETGRLEYADEEGLEELLIEAGLIETSATRDRVSRVEPVNGFLRWLFYIIRNRVSDSSCLAGFTRRWPCRWQYRIIVGENRPTFGPFKRRQDAIDHEVSWVKENLL